MGENMPVTDYYVVSIQQCFDFIVCVHLCVIVCVLQIHN